MTCMAYRSFITRECAFHKFGNACNSQSLPFYLIGPVSDSEVATDSDYREARDCEKDTLFNGVCSEPSWWGFLPQHESATQRVGSEQKRKYGCPIQFLLLWWQEIQAYGVSESTVCGNKPRYQEDWRESCGFCCGHRTL